MLFYSAVCRRWTVGGIIEDTHSFRMQLLFFRIFLQAENASILYFLLFSSTSYLNKHIQTDGKTSETLQLLSCSIKVYFVFTLSLQS